MNLECFLKAELIYCGPDRQLNLAQTSTIKKSDRLSLFVPKYFISIQEGMKMLACLESI